MLDVRGPEQGRDCVNQLLDIGGENAVEGAGGVDALKQQAQKAAQKSVQEWMSAARSALKKNVSTFAVLPVGLAIACTGQLREQGYEVEAPL